MANILHFEENLNGTLEIKMTQINTDKFHSDFEMLGKLGEGSFGEAFKVRSLLDGNVYAIKKAK
jgi:hypothetical protein